MSKAEQELLQVSIEVKRRHLKAARKELMIWEQRVMMLEEELQLLTQHLKETNIEEKDITYTYSCAKNLVKSFTKTPRTLFAGDFYDKKHNS